MKYAKEAKFWVILAFLAAFLVMLPSWNKYWAPYDEGNYLISARMVQEGMVPYRDFFLVMYPPAYAYTLAGLFSLFGAKLIVGRLYTVFLLSVISASVFYITRKVAPLKYALVAFVLSLGILAAWGEPPIPRPIWPGVAFSMLAVAFIMNFIEREKTGYLFLSSFFVALTTIFRHDIGFFTFLAISIGLLVFGMYGKKHMLKLWVIYSLLPLFFTGILFLWLYRVNALPDAVNAMFTVPATFSKWANIPFPKFCFNPGMIFHKGCFFIRQNKFYIPMLTCAVSGILFFTGIVSKKKVDKRTVSLTILVLLGVFYLQQLVFRVDGNHLAVSFPPVAILFGVLFTHKDSLQWKPFRICKVAMIAAVSLLMVLFFYRSTEKYIKDIYVKPFIKKSIEPVSFKQGTIYLPDDEKDTFVALVDFVEKNTKPGERIYLGHLKHNVPQMGWFDLVYFLADRIPAVKYHVMIPGFQSQADIQEEMAESLKRHDVRIVLLRDFGETDTLGPLDKYIRKEYKLEKIIGTYHIYAKK